MSSSGLGVASSAYATHCREVIDLINTFRSTGAHFDLDLPTIVFIGDQSTGKSSVLEALSAVPLPRADGTCTRCPTELRLSQTPATDEAKSSWRCVVKLRWEYDDRAQRPLQEVREEAFGSVLTDPAHVSNVVSRAQLALLNPGVNAQTFVTKPIRNVHTHEEQNQLRFSRNVVCVDVHGPDLSNLTLIDLPGIIRSADRQEDRVYVRAVKDMIKHYISKPNAILVCTVSCKQEMENTVVRELAREVDPKGERTLGVLTKPDRLERGAETKKLDVLMGKSFALKMGYWVVRNRTPDELLQNITFHEARANERRFFASTSPWNELPSTVRARLGVDSLEQKLSPLLTKKIIESLPGLKAEVTRQLEATRLELTTLPPALLETKMGVRHALFNQMLEFSKAIGDHTSARLKEKTLWSKVHAQFGALWTELNATAPVVSTVTLDTGIRHLVGQAVVIFTHDGWCPATITQVQVSPDQVASTRVEVEYVNFAAKEWLYRKDILPEGERKSRVIKPKVEARQGVSQVDDALLAYFSFTRTGPVPAPTAREEGGDRHGPRTLDCIHRVIADARGRQLPGDPPYEAKTRLIDEFLEEWSDPVQTCVTRVSQVLQETTSGIVEHMFGRFGRLESGVTLVVDELQRTLETEVRKHLSTLVEMERANPFTLNLSDLEESKIKYFDRLKSEFLEPPLPPSQDHKGQAEAIPGAALARRRRKEHDLEAIRVAADVMAYFDIAVKRFGDSVAMAIDHQFLLKFSKLVRDELVSKLGLVSAPEEELGLLLEEDDATARRRKELLLKQARLQKVRRELASFRASSARW